MRLVLRLWNVCGAHRHCLSCELCVVKRLPLLFWQRLVCTCFNGSMCKILVFSHTMRSSHSGGEWVFVDADPFKPSMLCPVFNRGVSLALLRLMINFWLTTGFSLYLFDFMVKFKSKARNLHFGLHFIVSVKRSLSVRTTATGKKWWIYDFPIHLPFLVDFSTFIFMEFIFASLFVITKDCVSVEILWVFYFKTVLFIFARIFFFCQTISFFSWMEKFMFFLILFDQLSHQYVVNFCISLPCQYTNWNCRFLSVCTT